MGELSRLMTVLKLGSAGLVALLAACQSVPPPIPATGNPFAAVVPAKVTVGDTFVYRYLDGFGNLPPSQVTYRVDEVSGERVVMSVTPETPREGYARTEVYTSNGNWLRHVVRSHNYPLDREFVSPYPAFDFPLVPGKSWSTRIDTIDPASKQQGESMVVKGKVIGAERVRVPAGEFDTIKVQRHVFIDHVSGFLNTAGNTHITETDWYAPALGRVVRSENQSDWHVSGKSPAFSQEYGDRHVYELISGPSATR